MVGLFLTWYFRDLPKKICHIWGNYLWFVRNYFSLSLLLKTFFSPWKRYYFTSKGRFDIGRWFGNFIFNSFSRIVGMILRGFVIITGVIGEIFVIFLGVSFFVAWLIFPFLLLYCLIKGITLI